MLKALAITVKISTCGPVVSGTAPLHEFQPYVHAEQLVQSAELSAHFDKTCSPLKLPVVSVIRGKRSTSVCVPVYSWNTPSKQGVETCQAWPQANFPERSRCQDRHLSGNVFGQDKNNIVFLMHWKG
jgi:hypothetical protein